MIIQKQLLLPAMARGFHLITDHVLRELPELGRLRAGHCTSSCSTPRPACT
ncbi:hypothetical protein [Hymenobacter sp. BT770]|uniref:hypothetical protein n=1 Tax=Hymenobacter sp. BT770 TaxID=2886942 RepID=UPI00293E06E7|nr:hypothetical protein [Hymenobacter sp. BT770]